VIPLEGDEKVSILGTENRSGGHNQGTLAVVGALGLSKPSLLEATLAVATSSHKRSDDKTGHRPLTVDLFFSPAYCHINEHVGFGYQAVPHATHIQPAPPGRPADLQRPGGSSWVNI